MSEHKITDRADMAVTPGDPPHPGEWIRRNVLKPFRLDVAKTARAIKMNRVNLSRVLSGDHSVTRDLAYRLEALTGVDADLIIGLQAAYDRSQERDRRATYAREIARLAPVQSEDRGGTAEAPRALVCVASAVEDTMAKPPNLPKYHLTKDAAKGDWKLQKEGGERATRRFDTKDAATKGGALSGAIGAGGGSVRIHKGDGRIQEERTFPRSRDPKSSEG